MRSIEPWGVPACSSIDEAMGVWRRLKRIEVVMGHLFRSAVLALSLVFLLAGAGAARAAVAWQASGAALSGTNVIGGLAVTWPAHIQGDVALLFVESRNEDVVTLLQANGFAAVANTPQATGVGAAGTRLTVFWARATSAAMLPPIITTPTSTVTARLPICICSDWPSSTAVDWSRLTQTFP